MGNGASINMICCYPRKESQIEDIDINKNSQDNYMKYKTIKMADNKNVIENFQKSKNNQQNYKKVQTHSRLSSANNTKKNIKIFERDDSSSQKDPNISLFNNTFQILNNTQQYISFSNLNIPKNNLMSNQILRSLYGSKINSSLINMSKINSNLEDLIDINIKLILTGALFQNKIIEIDKFGMKNGLRQKNDGIAIFGCKTNNDYSNIPLFDYYLDFQIEKKRINNTTNKKKNKGIVFEIFLDRKEKVFLLYFVHHTLILYYKISGNLLFELDKEYYLILGDIFLSVNVKRAIDHNEKIINIQVEIEDEKPKKYTFEKKDVPIKIGRVNCTIDIPKPSISKLHSIIDFSDDNFLYKDSESTNGSTLIIKEDDILKLKGEMNFKLEELSFKIKEIIIDVK